LFWRPRYDIFLFGGNILHNQENGKIFSWEVVSVKKLAVVLMILVGVLMLGNVYFVSTQMTPAEERAFLVSKLKEFTAQTGIKVELINLGYAEIASRVEAEQKTGKVKTGLVADLQGGLYLLASKGLLQDLSSITIPNRTFLLEKYAYVNGEKIFIPWLQATYVFVVNKEAFKYLPAGLTEEDVIKGTERWTYDALLDWARNIRKVAGIRHPLGFPMGPRGLWHRFLHGYIYPSFTGAQAIKFDSVRAIDMWDYLKKLMEYVNPSSSVWDKMDEPLMRGEVLIAWDHTARIKQAIVTMPDRFVVVPSPRGPMGRGYIVVLVGLAVPKNAPNMDEIEKLIEYLTSPEVQVEILKNVGFFPAVKEASIKIPEGALKILAEGVINQSATKDGVVAFIPNLGPKGGEFTATYREAFKMVVMEGENPVKVVKELGEKIRKMFVETGSPLPEPDASLY
jgi:multiple sugar transport system substrate-binding protein